MEKEKTINIFGRPHTRRAEVVTLNELSAHTDRNDLLNFAEKLRAERIFLIHGEEDQLEPLRKDL